MDKPHDFAFGPVVNPLPVFWLVLAGSRCVQIDGEAVPVREGDLVVFSPGSCYGLPAAEPGRPIRYLSLACHVKVGPFDCHDLYPYPRVTSLPGGAAVESLARSWTELVTLCGQGGEKLGSGGEARPLGTGAVGVPNLSASIALLRTQGTLQTWFAHVLTLLQPHLPDHPLAIDERIVEACLYMQEHVRESVLLEQLAAHVYLSPSHFSSLFRRALGVPPAHYLRKLRIRQAKELLLCTSLAVGEISQRVGYAELNEFSRAFRRDVGQSPKAYRQDGRMNSLG
jgi:AraC-like DNA-binding protein